MNYQPALLTQLTSLFIPFLVVIVLFFLGLFFTYVILKVAFHRRQNNHPSLRYFTAADFPNLEADEVEFLSRRGHKLRGAFYYYDSTNAYPGVIVFPHGIGAGHHAYMHLIEQFTRQGYIVFSYDNTGCQLSEGSSIRGIPQAIIDLDDALAYLDKTTYANKPRFVVGHSWGGYAALRSPFLSKKVEKVIAIAPFNDVGELLGKYIPIMRLLKPFIRIVHRLQFRHFLVNRSSGKLLQQTHVPTLVISGEKDDDIPLKGNYTVFKQAAEKNPNVLTVLAMNHRHNPYLTKASEDYVIDTILKGTQLMATEKDELKRHTFFASIDYSHIANHDEVVIKRMVDFLK
jgi:alpha-beta hydrolase superfamily lysophospholipase